MGMRPTNQIAHCFEALETGRFVWCETRAVAKSGRERVIFLRKLRMWVLGSLVEYISGGWRLVISSIRMVSLRSFATERRKAMSRGWSVVGTLKQRVNALVTFFRIRPGYRPIVVLVPGGCPARR